MTEFHLLVLRADGFLSRHDMYPDMIGSGSLFLKPFQKQVPFGKTLIWQGRAEFEPAADNS